MQYQLTDLLGFNDQNKDNLTIENCFSRYLDQMSHYLPEFINELLVYKEQKMLYVFPDSNTELASKIKKLIVCGFLLCYELTNSPVVLVQTENLFKNERLCTPDVLFYLVTLLQNLLIKQEVHTFDEQFNFINTEMQKTVTLTQEFFEVNMFNLKHLAISEKAILDDHEDPESFVKKLQDNIQTELVDNLNESEPSEFSNNLSGANNSDDTLKEE